MTNRKVNAVMVGAGAGGGVVAKELSLAGLSVVLFERGGWVSYDDHAGDELLSQRITVLGNSCGPDDVRYRRVLITADGNRRIVLPSESDYHNIAACVGSGTVTYGALALEVYAGRFSNENCLWRDPRNNARRLANFL